MTWLPIRKDVILPMFYCQKCGKKNKAKSDWCSFCGTLQEISHTGIEMKKCKRCGRNIPVASNYCYYCGMDQAKILLNDLKGPSEEKKSESKKEKIPTVDISDPKKLKEFIKLAQKEGLEVHILGKNESAFPGLLTSTKLFLRDWLNVKKRMGRADFWFGFLGMLILSIPAGMLISFAASIIPHLFPVGTMAVVKFGMAAWLAFYIVALLTALIRRLHDVELPAYLALLLFFPYTDIVALILAALPQRHNKSTYTFEGTKNKKKRHKK